MIHNKKLLLAVACTLCLSATGCGSTSPQGKEIEAFAESMVTFTQKVQSANDDLNAIDVTNVNATQDLLTILDNLEVTFQELADTPVPDYYKGIDALADEAYDNIQNAVSFYHSAYDAETRNIDDADIAYQYYTRAMTRLQYIGYVLSGEVPEGDNITVYQKTDDSQIVNKVLHSDED